MTQAVSTFYTKAFKNFTKLPNCLKLISAKLHHMACIFHSQCFPADFSQQTFISFQTASSETRKLLSFQQLLFSYTEGKLKGFEHVLNYLTKLQLKTMSETENLFIKFRPTRRSESRTNLHPASLDVKQRLNYTILQLIPCYQSATIRKIRRYCGTRL